MPVTPYNEWAPRDEEITLPSGKVVKLRRPDLVDLVASGGNAPDLLSELVSQMMQGSTPSQSDIVITPELLPKVVAAMNHVCMACFVEPKLWTEDRAEGDYIPVKWVSYNDKAFVFAWSLGGQFQPGQAVPE